MVDTWDSRLVLDTEAQMSSCLEQEQEQERRALVGTAGLIPVPPHTREEEGVPQEWMTPAGVRLPWP